jgi:hypothetical protein
MPYVVAFVVSVLFQILGSLLGRILVGLGLTFVSYEGFDVLLGQLRSHLFDVSGLPSYAIGFAGLIHLGAATNILLSALTAKFLISGMTSSITKLQIKSK